MSFDRAFSYVVSPSVEGDYSDDASDPGNWTGGAPGKGELRGTKWGISASRYPTLDIKSLDLSTARALYKRDFWDAARCGDFPDEIGFVLFDTSVNLGPHEAVVLLQRALRVKADGVVGHITLGMARALEPENVVVDFQAERILDYSAMKLWPQDGRGWARRVIRTAMSSRL